MKATDRFPRTVVRRLGTVLMVLLLGSAAVLAQTAGVKVTVADVIPVGNNNVPTQRIMSLVKTRPGSDYNQAVVDDDIRELYKDPAIREVKVKIQDAGQGK